MCAQISQSPESLLNELQALRARLEKVLPGYVASLAKVCQAPVEFDRRYRASWVDSLLREVKRIYQEYQRARSQVDLMSKFMTAATDIVLIAARKEPIPFPTVPGISIALYPEGKIEPMMEGNTPLPRGAAIVTFERFRELARKAKRMIMAGTLVPKTAEDIPQLIRLLAGRPPAG